MILDQIYMKMLSSFVTQVTTRCFLLEFCSLSCRTTSAASKKVWSINHTASCPPWQNFCIKEKVCMHMCDWNHAHIQTDQQMLLSPLSPCFAKLWVHNFTNLKLWDNMEHYCSKKGFSVFRNEYPGKRPKWPTDYRDINTQALVWHWHTKMPVKGAIWSNQCTDIEWQGLVHWPWSGVSMDSF